eukprot:TRINITY_DN34376_c0_g1_i1.p1 TRINITY_DN34376_c0_g1~~TRINITY_DN34376_c0_g1_i1.p1  ORF type:complete len:908 (-),score=120.88 TRINITY_DN34376_c0_g1_i1:312-2780(-)
MPRSTTPSRSIVLPLSARERLVASGSTFLAGNMGNKAANARPASRGVNPIRASGSHGVAARVRAIGTATVPAIAMGVEMAGLASSPVEAKNVAGFGVEAFAVEPAMGIERWMSPSSPSSPPDGMLKAARKVADMVSDSTSIHTRDVPLPASAALCHRVQLATHTRAQEMTEFSIDVFGCRSRSHPAEGRPRSEPPHFSRLFALRGAKGRARVCRGLFKVLANETQGMMRSVLFAWRRTLHNQSFLCWRRASWRKGVTQRGDTLHSTLEFYVDSWRNAGLAKHALRAWRSVLLVFSRPLRPQLAHELVGKSVEVARLWNGAPRPSCDPSTLWEDQVGICACSVRDGVQRFCVAAESSPLAGLLGSCEVTAAAPATALAAPRRHEDAVLAAADFRAPVSSGEMLGMFLMRTETNRLLSRGFASWLLLAFRGRAEAVARARARFVQMVDSALGGATSFTILVRAFSAWVGQASTLSRAAARQVRANVREQWLFEEQQHDKLHLGETDWRCVAERSCTNQWQAARYYLSITSARDREVVVSFMALILTAWRCCAKVPLSRAACPIEQPSGVAAREREALTSLAAVVFTENSIILLKMVVCAWMFSVCHGLLYSVPRSTLKRLRCPPTAVAVPTPLGDGFTAAEAATLGHKHGNPFREASDEDRCTKANCRLAALSISDGDPVAESLRLVSVETEECKRHWRQTWGVSSAMSPITPCLRTRRCKDEDDAGSVEVLSVSPWQSAPTASTASQERRACFRFSKMYDRDARAEVFFGVGTPGSSQSIDSTLLTSPQFGCADGSGVLHLAAVLPQRRCLFPVVGEENILPP